MSLYTTIAAQSAFQALGPFKPMSSGSVSLQMGTKSLSGGIAQTSVPVKPARDAEDWMDSGYATMLASEEVLARDWDSPEEDEAWADL